MKKAILFDLDGTLWDASGTVISAWNRCIAENSDLHRTYTVEQMKTYMGKTLDVIGDMMFPDLPKDERMRLMELCGQYETEYMRGAALTDGNAPVYFPGERETIETLAKDYFLAVVSNCQDGYIQIFLDQCGFGSCFSDFECARTGLDKAGNIGLVAQRNGIERLLYIGDTVLDSESARKAGVPFVHAGYGFGAPDDYDIRISAITELPGAAAELLG